MGEDVVDLKERTKEFSLRVIKLYEALPKTTVAKVLGRQVLRSATSVGAHYREALRARSKAEYVSKLAGGMQELEETGYWFELLEGAGVFPGSKLSSLVTEVDELMAILASIVIKYKKQ